MKRALFISALLHFLLLASFSFHIPHLGNSETEGGTPPKDKTLLEHLQTMMGKDEKITPKPLEPVKMKIVVTPPKVEDPKSKIVVKKKKDKKKEELAKKAKDNENKCLTYFWGIGVTSSRDQLHTCTISHVYENYPANQNDIRVGDHILSPECGKIRAQGPTEISIVLERNGKIINKTFNRGKICSEDAHSEPPVDLSPLGNLEFPEPPAEDYIP